MINKLALTLIIIGGINWGFIGFFQFDVVAWVFGGQDSFVSRIIYVIIGIAAIVSMSVFFRDKSIDNNM